MSKQVFFLIFKYFLGVHPITFSKTPHCFFEIEKLFRKKIID